MIDLDEQTAAMFGYAREQLIGRAVAELLVVLSDESAGVRGQLMTSAGEHRPVEIITHARFQ